MNKILSMIPILFLASGAYGFNINTTCINSSILYEQTILYHYINDTLESIETWNQTTNCPSECRNGMCIESNISMSSYASILSMGFIAIAGVLVFIGFKVDSEKYALLQILFIGAALAILLLSVASMQRFLAGGSYTSNILSLTGSGYSVIVWVAIVFIIIIVATLLFNVLSHIGDRIGKKGQDNQGG